MRGGSFQKILPKRLKTYQKDLGEVEQISAASRDSKERGSFQRMGPEFAW